VLQIRSIARLSANLHPSRLVIAAWRAAWCCRDFYILANRKRFIVFIVFVSFIIYWWTANNVFVVSNAKVVTWLLAKILLGPVVRPRIGLWVASVNQLIPIVAYLAAILHPRWWYIRALLAWASDKRGIGASWWFIVPAIVPTVATATGGACLVVLFLVFILLGFDRDNHAAQKEHGYNDDASNHSRGGYRYRVWHVLLLALL